MLPHSSRNAKRERKRLAEVSLAMLPHNSRSAGLAPRARRNTPSLMPSLWESEERLEILREEVAVDLARTPSQGVYEGVKLPRGELVVIVILVVLLHGERFLQGLCLPDQLLARLVDGLAILP